MYVIFGTEKKLDGTEGVVCGTLASRTTKYKSYKKHKEIANQIKEQGALKVYISTYYNYFQNSEDEQLIKTSRELLL